MIFFFLLLNRLMYVCVLITYKACIEKQHSPPPCLLTSRQLVLNYLNDLLWVALQSNMTIFFS